MKKTFRTRTYEIHTDKLKNGHKVRFAFLTDLHGLIYGNNHQELYDAVLKHDPAAVLVAGDMIVNRKTETLQAAAVLLSRLSEKIPVFYALGNHEYKMLLNPEVRQEYLNYERLLTSAGVCFLHNERISSKFYLSRTGTSDRILSQTEFSKTQSHRAGRTSRDTVHVGDTYSSGT